jgi:hypothetical protein
MVLLQPLLQVAGRSMLEDHRHPSAPDCTSTDGLLVPSVDHSATFYCNAGDTAFPTYVVAYRSLVSAEPICKTRVRIGLRDRGQNSAMRTPTCAAHPVMGPAGHTHEATQHSMP